MEWDLTPVREANEMQREQLEQQAGRTESQGHAMVEAMAALTIQHLAAEAQRAELLAKISDETIGQGAARAIQSVVGAPGFMQ